MCAEPLCILLVEDSIELGDLVADSLVREGACVFRAYRAEDVTDEVMRQADLMVLDLLLEDSAPQNTIESARGWCKKVHILVLSGYVQDVAREIAELAIVPLPKGLCHEVTIQTILASARQGVLFRSLREIAAALHRAERYCRLQ